MSASRQPRRIADHPGHALHALLRDAAGFEPPPDARERLLRRIEARHRRLVEDSARGDVLAMLIAGLEAPEPSSVQQTRVLRALGSSAERPRRLPVRVFAGVAAAACAASMTTLVLRPVEPDQRSVSVTAPPVAAARRAAPTVGTVFESAASEAQRMTVAGIGDLVLSGQTRLEVSGSDDRGVRLSLQSGRFALHAEKRKRSAPLVIASRGVDIEIVGTVLAIDATSRNVRVSVGEGLVEVRHGTKSALIGAGERWQLESTPRGDTDEWAASAMTSVAKGVPLTVQQPDIVEDTQAIPPRVRPPPTARREPATSRKASSTAPALTAQDLEKAASDARMTFDRPREALILRALADAPDATKGQVRSALGDLARLLDETLRRPLDAVTVRRELARRVPAERSDALLQVALALSELEHPDARAAVGDCLRECAEPARSFARFLGARQRQLDGDLAGANAAMKAAQSEAVTEGSAVRLSQLFFLRARHFLRGGQLDRARGAASLVRAFDPQGLHKSQLRQLGL